MKRRVSVIMINRNGGEYLRRGLQSLRVAMERTCAARDDFEFVLVDNGSTDDSVTIAQSEFRDTRVDWKLVEEHQPGVNSSRLAGLHAAEGRYVIFTDNDVIFELEWLNEYFRAIEANADCRVFAGRVLVGDVEGDIPHWLDLTGPYSRPSIVVRCDNGPTPARGIIGDKRLEGPVGPNMAIERSIFEDYGEFDIRFGMRPGSLVPGAEAEFFLRMTGRQEPFVYVPGASVYHPLKKNQISKQYFRERMTGIGQVLSRTQHLHGIDAKRLFGVKRYLYKALAIAWIRWLASWFQLNSKKRFFLWCDICVLNGQVREDRSRIAYRCSAARLADKLRESTSLTTKR